MRKLIAGIVVYAALIGPGVLTAQSPHRRAVQPTNLRYRGERKTLSEELVFQRALQRARQREARIQSRKWSGRSIVRPGLRPRHFTASFRPYWYGAF